MKELLPFACGFIPFQVFLFVFCIFWLSSFTSIPVNIRDASPRSVWYSRIYTGRALKGLKKCEFRVPEIKFYGVILSKDGIRTDPDKVKAVENLEIPKNKAELRSILGLTTYFSRFIKNYATIVEPLRELLRGKEAWEWGERHSTALSDIKNRLSSAGVMAYWRPDAKTRLTTDASPVGLGAIIEQQQVDGEFRPIAYASRSLSDVERRYSQTEKEGLGIVWGCEKF